MRRARGCRGALRDRPSGAGGTTGAQNSSSGSDEGPGSYARGVSGRTAYYDAEAQVYDETRGGQERGRAAAAAVCALVPPTGVLLDVAGGTGVVSTELAARGFDVLVMDLSRGMLTEAYDRLPGRVAVASAEQLPVPEGGLDVVTMVWLLHLLPIPVADRVIGEAARVVRPGGHVVTTVDKDLAHGRVRRTGGDAADRVEAVARRAGLRFVGQTSFSGRSAWGSVGTGDPVFPLAAYRRT